MGEIVIPVALLSGVFGPSSLIAAQRSGLFLVWSHDLGSFTEGLFEGSQLAVIHIGEKFGISVEVRQDVDAVLELADETNVFRADCTPAPRS